MFISGDDAAAKREVTDLLSGFGWPEERIIDLGGISTFLYHGDVHAEPEPSRRSLDVEIALPREWHEQPMALDPESPPQVD